ncbi:hypothetical protein [Halodurantibacterium flavum]|uniref:Uncharacterized protein n=1 Tax=Halodurantibacterium flavum TaxID=1382802 RepID=A0ABW4S5R1_9RHOB
MPSAVQRAFRSPRTLSPLLRKGLHPDAGVIARPSRHLQAAEMVFRRDADAKILPSSTEITLKTT